MKLVRKFAIYCAAAFALIGFILVMASPALVVDSNYGLGLSVPGTNAIFGANGNPGFGTALTAWIFALIALLGLICLCALPFAKKVKLDAKPKAFVGCFLALLLLTCGILVFCVKADAQWEIGRVGAGWIIAGIFYILAAIGVACDPVFVLLGK